MSTITRLNLGHVNLPDWHPRADDLTCPLYGYVIEHPDGIVVVDTGTRAGHTMIDELYAPTVISVVAALHDVGLDERDVLAVVNTHLHFDHCGQNHLLPNAPVWVTASELEAASAELYTVPSWANIDPQRRRLSSDGEVLADGIRLWHTPGHTPGHQSVAVETNDGLDVIVGQACYTCAEFSLADSHEFGVSEADMHDPSWLAVGRQSLARLHALKPRRAYFSHDRTTFVGPSDAR